MPEFDEDLIWDSIMESAKTKIAYAAFEALFPFTPDNFLSSIIYGFAMKRSPEAITANIVTQTKMTGNIVDDTVLADFVASSRPAIAQEIELTAQALNELARGTDPEAVYRKISAELGI